MVGWKAACLTRLPLIIAAHTYERVLGFIAGVDGDRMTTSTSGCLDKLSLNGGCTLKSYRFIAQLPLLYLGGPIVASKGTPLGSTKRREQWDNITIGIDS